MRFVRDPQKDRCCAFCEHWYNGFLKIAPARGTFTKMEFDNDSKSQCRMKGNMQMRAGACCMKFQRRTGL